MHGQIAVPIVLRKVLLKDSCERPLLRAIRKQPLPRGNCMYKVYVKENPTLITKPLIVHFNYFTYVFGHEPP